MLQGSKHRIWIYFSVHPDPFDPWTGVVYLSATGLFPAGKRGRPAGRPRARPTRPHHVPDTRGRQSLVAVAVSESGRRLARAASTYSERWRTGARCRYRGSGACRRMRWRDARTASGPWSTASSSAAWAIPTFRVCSDERGIRRRLRRHARGAGHRGVGCAAALALSKSGLPPSPTPPSRLPPGNSYKMHADVSWVSEV